MQINEEHETKNLCKFKTKRLKNEKSFESNKKETS